MTELLRESREGNAGATARLIPIVYEHQHALARHYTRTERPNHILTPTALLNEAYLKMASADSEWHNQTHFLFLASRSMRPILVDHAKTRHRAKRGARAHHVELEEIDICVELLYFGGLTYEEVAQALDISTVTVHRDLKMAKAWLRNALSSPNAP